MSLACIKGNGERGAIVIPVSPMKFKSVLFSALRLGSQSMLVRRSTDSFTGWVGVFRFSTLAAAANFARAWSEYSHVQAGSLFQVSVPVAGFPREFCTQPWLSLGKAAALTR
ncbi:MAG: hypothetical protein NW237_12475 [Cyanobacteriota bacterium]|nr:hypothetical protein [Cyanobacteriota bacterium]